MPPTERDHPVNAAQDWMLPVVALVGVVVLLAMVRGYSVAERVTGAVDANPRDEPSIPTCASCHEEAVAEWSESHHAMAQQLEPAGAMTLDGREVRVVGRIGVDPLVQWLVDDGRRRTQVTQLAEHVPTGETFDVFGDDREVGDWGHWTGGGMTWNRSCASCHGTEVRKGFDGSGYATTMSAVSVDCAACHGGLEGHARGQGAPTSQRGIDGCAPCHARRAELTDGYVVGADFLDHFAPALVDGTPDGLFWPDGQVREEVFEWTAFASSTMHTRGVVCVDCHLPHSGALVRSGDALCLGCHEALPGFEAHDPHEQGVGCVGCHMPVTTYMQRDPRHDHGFRIPDPRTGAALGVPDACGRCHDARDNVAAFEAWFGAREVDSRAKAFAEADVDGLLAVLRDDAPLWQASAAARLSQWVHLPRVQKALQGASHSGDALVRFGAHTALVGDPDATPRGLRDPSRAVRVAAARGAMADLQRGSPAAAAFEAYLSHNADQPDALVERGAWAFAQGDAESALADLEAAERIDPARLATLDALSVALSAVGRSDEAVQKLELAVGLVPGDGAFWGRLGLARAQAGDQVGAEAALERAAELGAHRAHYNLGLLLAQRGAFEEAVRALFAAARQDDTAEVRYALASTLWRWGRVDDARIAAKRVLELDSTHTGALELLNL